MTSLKLTSMALMLSLSINAQTIDTRKFIEVTGSAEMKVEPDEIELEIVLTEYDKNGKKVDLDNVNSDFNSVLKKHNVDLKTVTFEYFNSSWYYRPDEKKETYQTKIVNVKLSKQTDLLKLVEALDRKWVESVRISNKTNNEIQKFRREVKIEALKAAKEKAGYLLKSVGEEIGTVLSIEEVPDTYNYWWNQNLSVANTVMPTRSPENGGVENATVISLKYEVRVKFEIK